MSYEVVWFEKAVVQLAAIRRNMETHSGLPSRNRFDKHIQNFLDAIVEFPLIGRIEYPEEFIRGYLIGKSTRAFYRIVDRRVYLMGFHDVRKDPRTIKNDILGSETDLDA